MEKYKKEEVLKLPKQVAITTEVYKILKKERFKQKISMAKIVCNLIIDKFDNKKQ